MLSLVWLFVFSFLTGFEARAQSAGFLDPNVDFTVWDLVLQPDGRILTGGDFLNVGGQAHAKAARLNANGTLDASFQDPNVTGVSSNDDVYALARQTDGKVIIGGLFNNVGGQTRVGLARLNANGTLDTGFAPNLNSSVIDVVLQADGKILIGGYFTQVDGQTRSRVARLNTDGTLDTSFQDANVSDAIRALAVQPDGKIIICGAFTMVGGAARQRVARLNADGSVDASFNASVDSFVNDLVIQTDGKIVIGGEFTTVNSQARNRVARLNADGSLDTSFQDPGFTGPTFIEALALQPNGKVMVGGSFSSIAGQARNDVARLNANGTLDITFIRSRHHGLWGYGLCDCRSARRKNHPRRRLCGYRRRRA